jgi:hypothetical protein
MVDTPQERVFISDAEAVSSLVLLTVPARPTIVPFVNFVLVGAVIVITGPALSRSWTDTEIVFAFTSVALRDTVSVEVSPIVKREKEKVFVALFQEMTPAP